MYTELYQQEQHQVATDRKPLQKNRKKHQKNETQFIKPQYSGAKKENTNSMIQSNGDPFQKLDVAKDVSCSSIWLKKEKDLGDKIPRKKNAPKGQGFSNRRAEVDENLITNKVYMSFADPKLTEEVLRAYFCSLGKVTQLYICNSFGSAKFVYGFVKFNSKKLALRLVEQQMTMINGSPVRFRPVIEKDPFKIAKILKNQKSNAKKQKKSNQGRKNKKGDYQPVQSQPKKKTKNKEKWADVKPEHKAPPKVQNSKPRERQLSSPTWDIRHEISLDVFSNKRLLEAISDSHVDSDNVVFNLRSHRVDQLGYVIQEQSAINGPANPTLTNTNTSVYHSEPSYQ